MIRDWLDAWVHPSARHDPLTHARHHSFIAPRLLGSLAAFAAFPVYLAVRGAPSALEVGALGWLIAPILLSWFLSRTARYEIAHVLSSVALAGGIMSVAITTGAISSYVAPWLILLPLEASLSASRRVTAFASALALLCAALLILFRQFEILPADSANPAFRQNLVALGILSAALYATWIAFSVALLARASVSLLSLEEQRYRLLARNMGDVISCHARNGAVQFISPAAEGILGISTNHLLGHGLFERVHVADRPAYLTALSDVACGGKTRNVEFRLRRHTPNGSDRGAGGQIEYIWVEMRCRPLERALQDSVSSGAEIVAVMRDITDRKTQEQALELTRSAAEQAHAAKARFLATMSHELRTPLNAIIGFSEMMLHEDAMMLDATRRHEYTELIHDSGLHLLSVVNGILDISKIESGNFEISPEPFAPRGSLINCCNLLALKARESGIELVTDAPKDLPDIIGDPRAFKQVVLNLVSNAIKFTERGGTVTVSARTEGDRFVLRVSDTGVGIAPDDLQRIGDPFFQAGKTYERRHEGTGLGLSIVKSLVTLHNGEITVQSKIGEGTSITVMLPLAFSKPQTAQPNKVAMLNPPQRSALPEQPVQVKKSA